MNNDWLDIDVLEDYLDGKLDAKAMNRVERKALEDPFVAEALAGLSASPKRTLQSISLLQQQLHERIAEHKRFKRTTVITWQRLSIAATAAVLFVAVSIVFWMKENNYQKELAGRPKNVEVTIAPTPPEVPATAAPSAPIIAGQAAKTNRYATRKKQKPKAVESVGMPADQLNKVAVSAAPAQPVSLSLVPDRSTLGEVMVAGYAKGKKEEIKAAIPDSQAVMESNPIGGWDKLWTYIKQHNSFRNEKQTGQAVKLDFKIAKDGTPEDIKIIKGADSKYEQEAIRLMMDGPKWEQPKQADSRITVQIDF